MAKEEQENFLRLAIVIVDHAKDSFIELLNLHLSITKQSFEQFINLHRHEIFHLFDSRRCCKCPLGRNPQWRPPVIQKPQMALLFCMSSCGKHEFCCSVAKSGISTRVLDITLAKCLLINFCSEVFWYSCLGYAGLSLEQYLNNTKHDIYHLWQQSTSCCECDSSTQMPSRRFLDTSQWNQMYTSTSTPCNSHRKRPASGSVTCICSMTAKSGISLPSIDDSVKYVLIKQFCSVRVAIDFLATTIIESYGHVSKGQIPNAEYQTLMNAVEKSINEIAKVCNKENEFRSKLELAKTRTLDANLYNCYRNKMLEILTQELAIYECKSLPDHIAAKLPRLMKESTKPISEALKEGTFQQLNSAKNKAINIGITEIMVTEEQENFLRLAIVIVDHAKDSLIELLDLHLSITKQTFEQFINFHQHEIFHLFDPRRCCKCQRGSNPQRRTRVIQKTQMTLLFALTSCGKQEFCCSVAKPGISIRVLDMTLAKCLLINICSEVFWYSCLDYAGFTFEQYLNNTKHDIYHLWQHNTSCCECDPLIPLSGRSYLDTSQWNQMYSSTSTPCNSHRKRPASGSVTCICSMTAKSGISLPSIDDSVKDVLIKQFCSMRLAIDFLATTRNESYGHISEGQIPNAEYQTLMSEVEKSITEIAKVCNKENEFKRKLELVKTRSLDTNLYNCYHIKMLEIVSQHQPIYECLSEIRTMIGKSVDKTKLIKSVPGKIAAKLPRLMEESTKPISEALKEGTFQQLN